MTRIYKYYNFPLTGCGTQVEVMGFSGYPGAISSTDEFYVLDSGLVIMDTTLEDLNGAWMDNVKTHTEGSDLLPTFMHLLITHRLSKRGSDWAARMQQSNPGTYHAQFMVVDYN